LAEAFVQQNSASSHQAHAANAPIGLRPTSHVSDVQKLRAEIAHLELLIKKLQTELQIERQYNQALELHVRTLTQVD
jgi:TolA-binding protein